MKRFFVVLLSFMLGLFAFTACGDGDGSPSDLGTKYDITYYAVIDGEDACEVPQNAWLEDGSYPTEYVKGKATTVSNLKTSYAITVGDQEGVMIFGGWYLDEDCTVEFEGIVAETKDDLALYAKLTAEIDYTERTITYKAVIGNAVEDIPEGLFKKDGNYPTSYFEGKSVLLIDDLKAEYQTFNPNGSGDEYKFLGWYSDEACTQKFTGLTKETRGDVKLYAKISYAFWTPNA